MNHGVRWHQCVALALGVLATSMQAAEPGSDASERARIRAERKQVNSQFMERERECRTHFIVTACVDEAKREQRDQLSRLQSQELLLDEAQRKERAARSLETIRKNQSNSEAAAREAAEAASMPVQVKVRPSAASASAPRKPAIKAPAKAPVKSETQRRIDEAESIESFNAQASAAEEHRALVARRNAERAKHRKPAAPLPVPAGASAP